MMAVVCTDTQGDTHSCTWEKTRAFCMLIFIVKSAYEYIGHVIFSFSPNKKKKHWRSKFHYFKKPRNISSGLIFPFLLLYLLLGRTLFLRRHHFGASYSWFPRPSKSYAPRSLTSALPLRIHKTKSSVRSIECFLLTGRERSLLLFTMLGASALFLISFPSFTRQAPSQWGQKCIAWWLVPSP